GDGTPFEVRLEAPVAAHAAVTRPCVTANVLERPNVLFRKGFGQDRFRHAQTMADEAEAAIGWASVRVTTGVHDGFRRIDTENQSQQNCSTSAAAVKAESNLEDCPTVCPSSCVSWAVGR